MNTNYSNKDIHLGSFFLAPKRITPSQSIRILFLLAQNASCLLFKSLQ